MKKYRFFYQDFSWNLPYFALHELLEMQDFVFLFKKRCKITTFLE